MKRDWLLGEEVRNRVFGLDVMRSIAILIVVIMHGVFLLPMNFHYWYYLPIPAIDGVAIFFVLSGFLIGGILLRTLEAPQYGLREIGHFWLRRWFRTIPNYVLVVTLVLVFTFLSGYPTDSFHWGYYFFVQNLVTLIPDFFPESWSLSVEEWFYLITPLLILVFSLLTHDRKRAVPWVALLLIVVPVVLRVVFYSPPAHDAISYTVRYPKTVVFRLDALMYGVLMAYLYRYHHAACIRFKTVGLMTALALAAALTLHTRLSDPNDYFRAVWIPSLEPLPALLALPFLASWHSTRWRLLESAVRFVSTVSYSMYLLNLSLVQEILLPALTGKIVWGQPPSLQMGLLRYALFWVLSLALSWVLYRFFERPVRDLRDRIPLSKSRRATHSASK